VKLTPQAIVDSLPPSDRHRLSAFKDLLADRAVPLGMIAAADLSRLWERHVLDSVRGVSCVPARAETVADIGSGAGLPGIPIAVCRPDLKIFLVEPSSRRAGFLELVAEKLGLHNVRVVVDRAERLELTVDLCLARAVASPGRTWRLAEGLLAPEGRLLLWAGSKWPGAAASELNRRAVPWKICAPPGFSWEGPLVIMGGT